MRVTVSSRASSIDDVVSEEIRGRIYFSLSRFNPCIAEVTALIVDVAGARGNSQRLCRLSVRLNGLGSLSIESIEDDLMPAVSRAAERAAKQLQRILDRQRDETRSE